MPAIRRIRRCAARPRASASPSTRCLPVARLAASDFGSRPFALGRIRDARRLRESPLHCTTRRLCCVLGGGCYPKVASYDRGRLRRGDRYFALTRRDRSHGFVDWISVMPEGFTNSNRSPCSPDTEVSDWEPESSLPPLLSWQARSACRHDTRFRISFQSNRSCSFPCASSSVCSFLPKRDGARSVGDGAEAPSPFGTLLCWPKPPLGVHKNRIMSGFHVKERFLRI
jgi:hypothetical protein